MPSRHRAYCFTWNNYPADYQATLASLDCRYVVAGEELAPGTGTPHLQGYIVWNNAKSLTASTGLLPGCHLSIARATHRQNRAYCLKRREQDAVPNEVYYERGDLPADPADKGRDELLRWQSAWEAAKTGRLEDIPPDIRIRQYSSIRRIERDYMPAMERLPGPCGVWIYGESGAGKSRAVLDQFPELYPKPRSQWWDGYQGELVVLLDDVDKFDVKLGGKLKHWADAYPFIGETKGGSGKIRPKRVFVTSQYQIEDIWQDQETREALLRRFIVMKKNLGEEIYLF